jgi:enoyl-CoA hydratase
MSDYELLQVESDGPLVAVTINRPKALNALNAQVLDELRRAFDAVAENPAARGVVLTGTGRAFVAGADIAEMAQYDVQQAYAMSRQGHALAAAIEALAVPVVAAVNGFALGGGCELAMACDVIYASETAKFGQPEVNLGVIPGFGGTQRLSRLVGTQKARELVLSGRIIGADEALRIGLVARVVPAPQLLEEARALVLEIAAKGPLAVAAAKRVIQDGYDVSLAEANELEARAFADLFTSRDQKEGMSAFLEKRTPEFTGA